MSLPTTNRAELRRAIASEVGMEFSRRYPSYLTCDTGSTGAYIVDSDLTQSDDAWKNMWFFISANNSTSTGATIDDNVGEVRLIDRFSNKDNRLYFERPLPQAATQYDQYEIHDIWNAYEIHNAINRAIRDGMPNFFDMITDQTLVLKEDVLEYDISGLTYRPWIISEIWLEQPYNALTGTATAGASTSLTDSSADFSDATAGWLVSIYDGTGTGQLRTISSVTGTTQLNVSAAWTTNPSTDSKYQVWDPNEQHETWYRITSATFDNKEYPSTMRFTRQYSDLYGSRIRIVYASDALELASDTSTTVVPKEFVIYKAIEILASSRVTSPRADREHFALMEQIYNTKAEMYRDSHAFRMDTSLWQEQDLSGGSRIYPRGNPMGW